MSKEKNKNFLGKGKFGCVVTPKVGVVDINKDKCVLIPNNQTGNRHDIIVSKIFRNESTMLDEYSRYNDIISQVDPEHTFTVPLTESCKSVKLTVKSLKRPEIVNEDEYNGEDEYGEAGYDESGYDDYEIELDDSCNFSDNPDATYSILNMPYGGISLLELYKQKRKLKFSFEMFVEMILNICKGVQNMKDKGFIHMDIHMGNILLTDTDSDSARLILIDFGFARKKETIFEDFRNGTNFHIKLLQPEFQLLSFIQKIANTYKKFTTIDIGQDDQIKTMLKAVNISEIKKQDIASMKEVVSEVKKYIDKNKDLMCIKWQIETFEGMQSPSLRIQKSLCELQMQRENINIFPTVLSYMMENDVASFIDSYSIGIVLQKFCDMYKNEGPLMNESQNGIFSKLLEIVQKMHSVSFLNRMRIEDAVKEITKLKQSSGGSRKPKPVINNFKQIGQFIIGKGRGIQHMCFVSKKIKKTRIEKKEVDGKHTLFLDGYPIECKREVKRKLMFVKGVLIGAAIRMNDFMRM